jgi:8-oxo-dGTP pyrophosphatase MutT (NUDIX family)
MAMQIDLLLSALHAHLADDAVESRHLKDIIAFVERHADGSWWQRTTLEGHLTASAWVVDATRQHALLLHHAKLDRWLQPGGHIDATDASPAHAALREAREESGIESLAHAAEMLFDVDVHPIPARGAEPAHLHYDLRYLIISPEQGLKISDESLGAKWLPITEITSANVEPSIFRMADKTQRLKRI